MPQLQTNSFGCSCLSWNPAFDEPQMFVVGCLARPASQAHHQGIEHLDSEESLLQIYYKKEGATGQNYTLYSNKFKSCHTTSVNDVAWAPLMGRSFHMIASCSRDAIIVWKVTVRDIFNSSPEAKDGLFKEPVVETLFRVVDAHKEPWRLSWNLLGTCFASAGDDSAVRIWKRNPTGKGFS